MYEIIAAQGKGKNQSYASYIDRYLQAENDNKEKILFSECKSSNVKLYRGSIH